MISAKEAIDIVLSNVKEGKIKNYSLEESIGYVISEDILAGISIPEFNNSVMDGWAVRTEDLIHAEKSNPAILKKIGEIFAEETPSVRVEKNQAVYVTTGTMIPDGADAVIMQEEVKEENNFIIVKNTVKNGQNIRFTGEEIKKGEVAIKKGSIIGPLEIGFLAKLGILEIKCYQMPSISIITTGGEVLSKIKNSNLPMFASFAKDLGCKVVLMKNVLDDEKEILNAILVALDESDIILTSGGVSVGKKDLVRDAIIKAGFDILFHGVRQRPGKPLLFARKDEKILFGIPGNPGSAFVCLKVYVEKAIKKFSGKKDGHKKTKAVLKENVEKKKDWTFFVKARIYNEAGKIFAEVVKSESSAMLRPFVESNGILILEEGREYYKKGEVVDVIIK